MQMDGEEGKNCDCSKSYLMETKDQPLNHAGAREPHHQHNQDSNFTKKLLAKGQIPDRHPTNLQEESIIASMGCSTLHSYTSAKATSRSDNDL